jgi:7-carboxy-7-deazaguanine synthase
MTKCSGVEEKLLVTEIFLSIQGESTWMGCPCTFIRLTGCPLRCTYCDTAYAFSGGTKLKISEIIEKVENFGCRLVEVTGGEPLAQKGTVHLLEELVERQYTVLLETSGALAVKDVPPQVHKIMDIKTPTSGESENNKWENLDFLSSHDEIKFVIGDRSDYDWAKNICSQYALTSKVKAVLFSPVFGRLNPQTLVSWLLEDRLFEIRFQLQLHKYIWHPDTRGV